MPKKGDFKANAKPASVAKRAFNSSEKQKTRRAERNASRAKMVQAGKAHKGMVKMLIIKITTPKIKKCLTFKLSALQRIER